MLFISPWLTSSTDALETLTERTTRRGRAEWAKWRPSEPYSVGIEEEVMLLDPAAWTLTERGDEVLAMAGAGLAGRCVAETHDAALELRTAPHATVREAVAEMRELRRLLVGELDQLGMAAASCGTHPGPLRVPTRVSPSSRYQVIQRTMRGLARREPTFALHVHVGVPDSTSAIRLMNQLRAHLPMLLALSASSPFLNGRDTGLASNRTIVFQGFPRTGIPRRFDSYADWVGTLDVLLRSGAIPEPTFLWWDVRPQPRLGTVEIRIMDAQPSLGATAALVALVQAVARLELEQGFAQAGLVNAQEVLAENRFIAARDGAAAELIDPRTTALVPLASLLEEVLAAARPHAAALDAGEELAGVRRLVAMPEAHRQQRLAASFGVSRLVADLAARFAS
ncbi:MAG TPA: YbdK family carboxylate-amine ligase [Solirubrobacteraceae bacterium]|nr:YbdK family carboxylate-amine ligase [Solirubrobacteraceae bacterium]